MELDNTNTSLESPLIIEVVDDNEKLNSSTTNKSSKKVSSFRKQLTPKEKNYIHKFIDSLKK